MHRRHLLAHISAGTAVAVGGCLGTTDAADKSEETTSPDVDAHPCPSYSNDRNRTVCSRTVDTDTASVYLNPTPQTSALSDGTPADEITLTLHNQSSTELRFNPYSWRIWHQSETDWIELQQQHVGGGVVTVSPHDTHTWSFLAAVESIRNDPTFKPGLYAAGISVPDPESDNWVDCIGLVRLESSK